MTDIQVRYTGSKATKVLELGGHIYKWTGTGNIQTVPDRFQPEIARYSEFTVVTPEYVYHDTATNTITAASAGAHNLLIIPAYTEITGISVENGDFGTSAPFDLGYAPTDGTTGDADAFLNDYAGGTATVAGAPYSVVLATPITLTKESYLKLTFGTVADGAETTITVSLTGFRTGLK